MCNEYAQERSLDELLREFGQLDLPLTWDGGAPNMEPRASVRPTDPSFVVAGRDVFAEPIDCWNGMTRRQDNEPLDGRALHQPVSIARRAAKQGVEIGCVCHKRVDGTFEMKQGHAILQRRVG